MVEFLRKIARRFRKPELEKHIDRELAHSRMPAESFVKSQARATDTAVYKSNAVVSAMGTGRSTETYRTYWLEKVGDKVFFNCVGENPVLLSKGVHYIFGSSGLVIWDGKTRLSMSQHVVRVDSSKVAPIESVFFVDREGNLHIKRFNRGWHDQIKIDIISKVSEYAYKDNSPLKQIAEKLNDFKANAKVFVVNNTGNVLTRSERDAKLQLLEDPRIARDKSGFVLKIGNVIEPLKERSIYVFGRFGLFELNSTVNQVNNVTKRMERLDPRIANVFSRIESIFQVHNGKVYLLTY